MTGDDDWVDWGKDVNPKDYLRRNGPQHWATFAFGAVVGVLLTLFVLVAVGML